MARLNRDQSIHPERQRTLLMTVISPFLLYGAEVYLGKLREITIDSLLNSALWQNVLSELIDDWKEFTLYVRLYNFLLTVFSTLYLMIYHSGNCIAQRQRCISGDPECRQLRICGSSFKCPESKLFFDSEQYWGDCFGFAFG
jgi:hypothetical protein